MVAVNYHLFVRTTLWQISEQFHLLMVFKDVAHLVHCKESLLFLAVHVVLWKLEETQLQKCHRPWPSGWLPGATGLLISFRAGLVMVAKRFVSLWVALSYGYRSLQSWPRHMPGSILLCAKHSSDVHPCTLGHRVPTGIPNTMGVASFWMLFVSIWSSFGDFPGAICDSEHPLITEHLSGAPCALEEPVLDSLFAHKEGGQWWEVLCSWAKPRLSHFLLSAPTSFSQVVKSPLGNQQTE